MRFFVVLAFLILSSLALSQEWRDSLDIARDAYSNKEYVKALRYYESAQKNAPENVDLSDEMAQSAYKAREFEQAEKIYQQSGNSKKTGKEKADNWYNLGNSRMKKRDFEGAAEAYKESLRLNPNDDQARYNLSEAIRQVKNQSKKQQGNSQQQNNQKNQQQNNQGQPNDGNQQGGKQDSENQGQLSNKTVEKMLDKLMKDEAETKRRMTGNDHRSKSNKSGKDW